MATLTAFSSLHSICRLTSPRTCILSRTHLPFVRNLQLETSNSSLTLSTKKQRHSRLGIRKLRCVREETSVPEQQVLEEEEQVEGERGEQQQETVSVPVSPSDTLTMFFQADGMMNETAIPTITKALEETDGISNLKVEVQEGIATVELAKQTTVQATGVASSLVEIIQGAGFKLQTLNLSFEDEEDVLV